MKPKLLVFLLVLPILLISVLSTSPEEYLSEFNNTNEKCTSKEFIRFDYDESTIQSEIYFYQCCTDEDCVNLPFDLTLRTFQSDYYINEFFQSKFVIDQIKNKEIPNDHYYYKKLFDVCTFFGEDKLHEQYVSVTAEGVYEASPFLFDLEKANAIRKSIELAKKTGKIAKFSLWTLIPAVTCNHATNLEKEVISKMQDCYRYYHILENNYAYPEIINHFEKCNNEALEDMEKLKKDYIAKTHDIFLYIGKVINFVINFIINFFKYFSNLFENEKSTQDVFDVGQTVFEWVDYSRPKIIDTNNKITIKSYLEERDKAINRIRFKKEEINGKKQKVDVLYKKINSMQASFLEKIFINSFSNIKLNYTTQTALLFEVDEIIKSTETLVKNSKYNSANAKLPKTYPLLFSVQNQFNKENCKDRQINYSVYIILILLFSLFILSNKYIKSFSLKFTLNLLIIFLFFFLLSTIIFLFSNINDGICKQNIYISKINKTDTLSLIKEINYTLRYNKTNYLLVSKENNEFKLPKFFTEPPKECTEQICEAEIKLLNLNEFPINVNLSYKLVLISTNNNKSISVIDSNITLLPSKANRIYRNFNSQNYNSLLIPEENFNISININKYIKEINFTTVIEENRTKNVSFNKNFTKEVFILNLTD